MPKSTHLSKLFWQMYGLFIISIAMLSLCIVVVSFGDIRSFSDVMYALITEENLKGVAVMLGCFILIEPLLTPCDHRAGWMFQKIFWTVALLSFYLFVILKGYDDYSLAFFLPLIVYLIRILVPYSWVRRWTTIFYSLEENKT